MNIRITLNRPTVKVMHARLQQAYAPADVRLVRRISALLEHLVQQTTVSLVSERWGFSVSYFYGWLNALILDGVSRWVYQHGGGRPLKLTPAQRKQLCAWLVAGALAVGFAQVHLGPVRSDPQVKTAGNRKTYMTPWSDRVLFRSLFISAAEAETSLRCGLRCRG